MKHNVSGQWFTCQQSYTLTLIIYCIYLKRVILGPQWNYCQGKTDFYCLHTDDLLCYFVDIVINWIGLNSKWFLEYSELPGWAGFVTQTWQPWWRYRDIPATSALGTLGVVMRFGRSGCFFSWEVGGGSEIRSSASVSEIFKFWVPSASPAASFLSSVSERRTASC